MTALIRLLFIPLTQIKNGVFHKRDGNNVIFLMGYQMLKESH